MPYRLVPLNLQVRLEEAKKLKMLTTNETRRLKAFSRKVWNGLTASEQCEFYYDTGTIGFVRCVAELLHIRLTDDDYETLYAIQKYATEVKRPI